MFTVSRTFAYDDLNRLTSGSGTFGTNQAQQNCAYAYNAIGDITNKCGAVFSYGDVMHPSAVTFNPTTGKSYTYDANGNMLTRGNQTLTWDIDNRVSSVSITGGGTTSMEYDYSGARVKKSAPTGITLYPFSGYEIDPNGVITKFIRVGGESIASKRGTSKYFYHNDHLGSVNVITDIAGTRVQLNEYDPWGAVSRASGTIDPDTRFTGQKLDPETGLYYYGGRYYDAEIGRFVSADPFVQTPYDPQNLNRYSYVINNPQNLIDPDGYFHQIKKKKKGGFLRSFFGMFIGAIVTIVTAGQGAPLWLAGAMGGFVAGGVNTAINGGNPLRNMLGGAFLGALGGAIGGVAFEGLGGVVGGGFTAANFGAAVGAAAISGAVTGAVATGIYGGKFGKNVGFGALASAISAAVVYGGAAAWNALNGNSGSDGEFVRVADLKNEGVCDACIPVDSDGNPVRSEAKLPGGLNKALQCNGIGCALGGIAGGTGGGMLGRSAGQAIGLRWGMALGAAFGLPAGPLGSFGGALIGGTIGGYVGGFVGASGGAAVGSYLGALFGGELGNSLHVTVPGR